MDRDALLTLPEEDLAEYLWRRLRREGPLDPPLRDRFGDEAPEDLLIDLARDEPGAFRDRLIGAMRRNLARLAPLAPALPKGDRTLAQVESLALLAEAVRAEPLVPDLFGLALALWSQVKQGEGSGHGPLFFLLDAIGTLQSGREYQPFWEAVVTVAPEPGLRGIGWYGLAQCAPDRIGARLPDLLADRDLDLPTIAWNFATDRPGLDEFAAAVRRLPEEDATRIRDALAQAGADADTLARFEHGRELFPHLQGRHARSYHGPLWQPSRQARAA